MIGSGIVVWRSKGDRLSPLPPSPTPFGVHRSERDEKGEKREDKSGKETDLDNTDDEKKLPGELCLTSYECPKGYFCLLGLCCKAPTTFEEIIATAANDGMVCLDKHLLRLTSYDRFTVLPGWWSVKNVLDVCDSEVEGFVYVLTKDSIYWLPTDKPALHPVKISSTSVDDGGKLIRLFIYRNHLTALTDKGKLYRGFNFRHGHSQPNWNWEIIDFLAGRDLSSETIVSVAISEDGLISLTLADNRRLYYLNQWLEDPTEIVPTKLLYSAFRTTILHLEKGTASLYLYDETLLYTVEKVIDCCIDPNVPSSIIVTKETGPRRYRLVYGNIDFTPDDLKRLSNYSVIVEPLIGDGRMLLTTRRDIWMVANPACVRI